jgi:hypothetical protein
MNTACNTSAQLEKELLLTKLEQFLDHQCSEIQGMIFKIMIDSWDSFNHTFICKVQMGDHKCMDLFFGLDNGELKLRVSNNLKSEYWKTVDVYSANCKWFWILVAESGILHLNKS